MTIALLLGACALVLWPARPIAVAGRTPAAPARRIAARLDAQVPALMSAAAFGLAVLWKPTVAGMLVGALAAWGTFVLLRRQRSGTARAAPDAALPLVLTVAALLLRSGTPPATALAAAARSCDSASRAACEQVERRLAMGEAADRAWGGLRGIPDLAAVGRAAVRTSDSGAALAGAWESIGAQLRAESRLASEVRARKVGVRVLAPLGLCFLPSFICLGVVPMVIGLASDIL